MLTLPPALTAGHVVQESGNLFESAFAVLDASTLRDRPLWVEIGADS